MSATAKIRNFVIAGDIAGAESELISLLGRLFPLKIQQVMLNKDNYALNSVNGFIEEKSGKKYFFKFHQEDGEEAGVDEYYNSQVLEKAGFSVEKPKWQSTEVGEQILVYEFKNAPRFSEVCEDIELQNSAIPEAVINAQKELDELTLDIYKKTYKTITCEQAGKEPINQLFYRRLVDKEGDKKLGARAAKFYANQQFEFADLIENFSSISFEKLLKLNWQVNGISYCNTLENAFNDAIEIMHPEELAKQGAVTAHSDAHNANVWYNNGGKLSLFDPAFASENVPALLAEVKATFHNIFAHPFWLYNTKKAAEVIDITAKIDGGIIRVNHNWQLTDLRQEFLRHKTIFWTKWLKFLQKQGNLPANWRKILRISLFCCPSLVINMRANSDKHNYKTSLLALTICIMLSSEPENGENDIIKQFFDDIEQAIS